MAAIRQSSIMKASCYNDEMRHVDGLAEVSTLKSNSVAPGDVSSLAILDVDATVARLGGDRQLFAEMITFLLDDSPPLASRLRSAVGAGDSKAIQCGAHALRGLLLNCGGDRAAYAAQALEDAGRAHDLDRSSQLFESLNIELETLIQAIHKNVKRDDGQGVSPS